MFYISWGLGLIALIGTGMLWYSKLLFGKQWTTLHGFTAEQTANKGKAMAFGILMNLIISGTLNWLVVQNNLSLFGAVELALFIWIGLVGPFHANEVIFGKKPWALFWLDSGYQIVGLLLVGLMSSKLLG